MHLVAALISVFAPQSKQQSHSHWQVNWYGDFRGQNCGPLKFCGPVRPNTSNMPKAGPGLQARSCGSSSLLQSSMNSLSSCLRH